MAMGLMLNKPAASQLPAVRQVAGFWTCTVPCFVLPDDTFVASADTKALPAASQEATVVQPTGPQVPRFPVGMGGKEGGGGAKGGITVLLIALLVGHEEEKLTLLDGSADVPAILIRI